MKKSEQLNFSASFRLVHSFGSSALRRCISVISTSVRWYFFSYDAFSGGGIGVVVGICGSIDTGRVLVVSCKAVPGFAIDEDIGARRVLGGMLYKEGAAEA